MHKKIVVLFELETGSPICLVANYSLPLIFSLASIEAFQWFVMLP